jgi:hypothetical protein
MEGPQQPEEIRISRDNDLSIIHWYPNKQQACTSTEAVENDLSKRLPCTMSKAVSLVVLWSISNLHFPHHQPCIIPDVLLAIQSGEAGKRKGKPFKNF